MYRPLNMKPLSKRRQTILEQLKIGICADVHHDLIPDAPVKLSAFIAEMNHEKADFIIQLGDFCKPLDCNKPFMDIWNSFKGPSYHVIGNHDGEKGTFSKEYICRLWNMKSRYYSFDCKGWHFIVLDGNEVRPDIKEDDYPRFIGQEQRQWLEEDINRTDLPVMLFCHQGTDIDVNVPLYEGTFIRRIFERANEKAGYRKVSLFLSGHHHSDYHNVINNIHYVQINSMSYQWRGEKYSLERPGVDPAVYKKYPYYKYVVPYKDPLWALLTADNAGGVSIRGKKSEFIGPSPDEMGLTHWEKAYPMVPYISDRIIPPIK
jgi:predicted phosphodiesterase